MVRGWFRWFAGQVAKSQRVRAGRKKQETRGKKQRDQKFGGTKES